MLMPKNTCNRRLSFSSVMQSNFFEITLRHGCYLVNLLHIFRTPFPKNTSGELLLYGQIHFSRKSYVFAHVFYLHQVQAFINSLLLTKNTKQIYNRGSFKSLLTCYVEFFREIVDTFLCCSLFLKKLTNSTMFSCEYCEIFKTTCFEKNLGTAVFLLF